MADTITRDTRFSPLDDASLTAGKNGQPPSAEHMQALLTRVNAVSYRGRSIFHWWGGDATTNNSDNLLRTIWNHHHTAGTKLRGEAIVLPATGAVQAGQGIRGTITATTYNSFTGDKDLSGWTLTEPTGLEAADFFTDVNDAASGRVTVQLGSLTSNGPYLTAGMLYEPAQNTIDVDGAYAFVADDWVGPDRAIVATSSAQDVDNVRRIRTQFLHAWNRKRPSVAWSMVLPGTNYVAFLDSKQQYRYIFDQAIGDTGTAPNIIGPGITFPLRYSAAGRATTIKLAIYIYAAMSGGTDTGKPALSAMAAGGASMTAFSQGTNFPTVSGTGFAWYPAVGATPWTFAVDAQQPYQRLLLAAKSSGATDHVRIGAFAIFPMHSVTIT